ASRLEARWAARRARPQLPLLPRTGGERLEPHRLERAARGRGAVRPGDSRRSSPERLTEARWFSRTRARRAARPRGLISAARGTPGAGMYRTRHTAQSLLNFTLLPGGEGGLRLSGGIMLEPIHFHSDLYRREALQYAAHKFAGKARI